MEDNHPTDIKLLKRATEWKKFVWIISTKEKEKNEESRIYTGFCIHESGTILTTFIDPEVEVWARNVYGFEGKLSWLLGKKNWGISAYKIDQPSGRTFPYVELVEVREDWSDENEEDENEKGWMYKAGEQVISIRHASLDTTYAILVGQLGYGMAYKPFELLDSLDNDNVLEWRKRTGKRVDNEYFTITHPYLVRDLRCRTALTCLVHDVYDDSDPGRKVGTGDHLHPDLPLLHLDKLHGCVRKGIHQGAEGGPVFNANGLVIGMMSVFVYGQDFAIHSNILRRFCSGLLNQSETSKMTEGTSSEEEDEEMES